MEAAKQTAELSTATSSPIISAAPSYVSMHNHSVYSLLDGLSTPWKLAGLAKRMKMPAIALTDHGTCAGLYAFMDACRNVQLCEKCGEISEPGQEGCSNQKCDGRLGSKGGVKPIFGIEAYFVDNAEERNKDEKKWHLTLWAKNKIGYHNLIKLSSISHTRYFYGKGRLDFNAIKAHSEGIMVGTACAVGVVCGPILEYGDPARSRKYVTQFHDHFRDDFYIEIMTHKFADQNCTNPKCDFRELTKKSKICPLCGSPLIGTTERLRSAFKEAYVIAQERGIKPIWTCDAHYPEAGDWFAHDVLCSMQTHNTIKNQKRFTFASDDFYLKSPEQAAKRVPSNPEFLANTLELAAKVEDNIMEVAKDTLPNFELPPGVATEMDLLKSLVVNGMKTKGLNGIKEYRDRALMEFKVIEKTGYARYFLILHDVISYAHREGIRVGPGRGSGVASLCLYSLGITALDPVKYRLMFSRFLNADRISPPDVDMDFDRDKQQQIIDYCSRKYGTDCVVRIATYGSLRARDAIKRTAKALDIGDDFDPANPPAKGKWESGQKTLDLVGKIASFIPEDEIKITIDEAVAGSEALQALSIRYPKLFEVAKSIEGTLSTASVHAAGTVICRNPVVNYVPLQMSDSVATTQFTMTEVEALGLLKFDFLSLKALTMVELCLKMIKQRTGKDIDINALEPDGPDSKRVFNMLNREFTDGVFQFESAMATKMLSQVKVDTFEDMIVVNALNRPGPLGADIEVGGSTIHGVHNLYDDYKQNRRPVEYAHPKMQEALKYTYGLMVFQEDVIQVAQDLAGYTPSQADKLRKACGKKKPEIMQAERGHFVEGCQKNGADPAVANKVFDLIALFAGYGFNRSHAAAYSVLAYQTAWLKCYYSREFFAALLSVEDKEDKRIRHERAATAFTGMPILPPHVSRSSHNYLIEDKGFRKPMSAVKGVGGAGSDLIIKNQPYANLGEFVRKLTGQQSVNINVVKVLAEAGAMDEWGIRSDDLVRQFEATRIKQKKSMAHTRKYGTAEGSLFD